MRIENERVKRQTEQRLARKREKVRVTQEVSLGLV